MTISSRNAACSRACTPLVVCGCKQLGVTLTFVVAAVAAAFVVVIVVVVGGIAEATVEGWGVIELLLPTLKSLRRAVVAVVVVVLLVSLAPSVGSAGRAY